MAQDSQHFSIHHRKKIKFLRNIWIIFNLLAWRFQSFFLRRYPLFAADHHHHQKFMKIELKHSLKQEKRVPAECKKEKRMHDELKGNWDRVLSTNYEIPQKKPFKDYPKLTLLLFWVLRWIFSTHMKYHMDIESSKVTKPEQLHLLFPPSKLSLSVFRLIRLPSSPLIHLITLRVCSWSLKFVSPKVIVAAQEMFARSSWVTKSFTASEWASSFCENVVTVSHLKNLMNAIRAGLCDESGMTVRKKYGNSSRSLRAGARLPNETLEKCQEWTFMSCGEQL